MTERTKGVQGTKGTKQTRETKGPKGTETSKKNKTAMDTEGTRDVGVPAPSVSYPRNGITFYTMFSRTVSIY